MLLVRGATHIDTLYRLQTSAPGACCGRLKSRMACLLILRFRAMGLKQANRVVRCCLDILSTLAVHAERYRCEEQVSTFSAGTVACRTGGEVVVCGNEFGLIRKHGVYIQIRSHSTYQRSPTNVQRGQRGDGNYLGAEVQPLVV